jgi:NAD(P)-dependent dehydrogenase (short-subunit alcohol dehydrogenase family)
LARVFITGSTDGLGRGAAQALLDDGHEVVLHARNAARAGELGALAARAAGVVVGDLASAAQTRELAAQVNAIGRMDAVIHNAGLYLDRERVQTPEGHARTLAVNTLAPYLLTALIERPARLIYMTSGLHLGGDASLRDLDWRERRWSASQAYADSKLLLVALAFALARRWPDVRSNAVNPGWVPTRMGGPGAPDDLEEGWATQVWLAVSEDPQAAVSGAYWFHRSTQPPAQAAADRGVQEALLGTLARMTAVALP